MLERGTNAPPPEPAAARGRVEGWAGAPAEAVRASTRPCGPAQHEGGWEAARPEAETRNQRSSPRAGRGTRPCRGMGRRSCRGRACLERPFGPLSMKGDGELLGVKPKRKTNAPHPEPAAARGRVEGWAGAAAEAVRASTGPAGRLSMKGDGELPGGMLERGTMPLIQSRPRHAVVWKGWAGAPAEAVHASTRPCGPAQHEGGWGAARRDAGTRNHAPHPEPAAARGRVEGWAGAPAEAVRASTRPCGPLSMKGDGEPPGGMLERGTNAPHPEPAAARGRVEGWAGAPAEAVRASTRPCGPAQHEGGMGSRPV